MERFNEKIIIENSMQRKLFLEIKKMEGLSQRKLAKRLKISRNSIKNWASEDRKLPKFIFEEILEKFPWASEYRNYVHGTLPRNWAQIKGGKIRSKMKNNLTNDDRVKGFRLGRLGIKRKTVGPNGELMFNDGEKRIAEELIRNKINYVYEPVILLGENYAIPDFIVNNTVIERCGYRDWKPYWSNIKRKIKRLKKYENYKIIILVPSKNFDMVVKILKNVRGITILKEENLEALLDILKIYH
ncbi:MAG: helix-turn-helix domain-containing protein [Nanoarchaeota archaeon]|nr:helix-turn-helix domain-containing protein [Nanoarchaeota archaeon]